MLRSAKIVESLTATSWVMCALVSAAPAHAEPSTTDANTTKLLGMVSKGFTPANCDTTDLATGQLAAIVCMYNANSGGPWYATYALYPDAHSLQSGFFATIGDEDQLVACPEITQSPSVYHYRDNPNAVVGHISCGKIDQQSEVVWTTDADLLLAAAQSLDEVPVLYRWWLDEG